LSSSAYGPEEAYRAVAGHNYLAVALALATAGTVWLIATAYSRIIEEFPAGGGGYAVASKLLGPRLGLVAGCALAVDYVLTVTISIAAAGDAIFSFLPLGAGQFKVPFELLLIGVLVVLNLRGVRESVVALVPLFVLFVATHAVVLAVALAEGLAGHLNTVRELAADYRDGAEVLGWLGLTGLFTHAYSLGAGTYTGIEAVSNGLPLMREPRVQTAKRTMIYMAASLSLLAAGLLVAYLLLDVQQVPGKTHNAVLADLVGQKLGLGRWLSIPTLLASAFLLFVAAQTGFLGGPRVLANLAVDSFAPRRFAQLSERLTAQNGIALVGAASVAALIYTAGDVDHIVVMYAINVFVAFSLASFGMLLLWLRRRGQVHRRRRSVLFALTFVVTSSILGSMIVQKFHEGAWLTLVVTGICIAVCAAIRRHYLAVGSELTGLDKVLDTCGAIARRAPPPMDAAQPTAVILVGGYSGVGMHTFLNVQRSFPEYFKNFVFVSVGVVDSGSFKGASEIEALKRKTEADLGKFVEFARANGLPAESASAVGTEVVSEAVDLCNEVAGRFPRSTFFASKVVFHRERWFYRLLHNETAYAVQRRLHAFGRTMVVLPVTVS
jgi:amino acid transporter